MFNAPTTDAQRQVLYVVQTVCAVRQVDRMLKRQSHAVVHPQQMYLKKRKELQARYTMVTKHADKTKKHTGTTGSGGAAGGSAEGGGGGGGGGRRGSIGGCGTAAGGGRGAGGTGGGVYVYLCVCD